MTVNYFWLTYRHGVYALPGKIPRKASALTVRADDYAVTGDASAI